jgi:hypothetical protein
MITFMLLLYMFKFVIWLCILPFKILLWPLKAFSIVFGKKERGNNGFVTGMMVGDLFHHL